jgi:hypothetical protein
MEKLAKLRVEAIRVGFMSALAPIDEALRAR